MIFKLPLQDENGEDYLVDGTPAEIAGLIYLLVDRGQLEAASVEAAALEAIDEGSFDYAAAVAAITGGETEGLPPADVFSTTYEAFDAATPLPPHVLKALIAGYLYGLDRHGSPEGSPEGVPNV